MQTGHICLQNEKFLAHPVVLPSFLNGTVKVNDCPIVKTASAYTFAFCKKQYFLPGNVNSGAVALARQFDAAERYSFTNITQNLAQRLQPCFLAY